MKKRGLLISIEGTDGTGKTSVIEAVSDYFKARGSKVMTSREPGGVRISEEIRRILLSKEFGEMDPRTEALLFAAARRQHLVEKVAPSLEAGDVVILDRYVDSSLAYQGHARGIGITEVKELNAFAIEGLWPDLTLLLDMDTEAALARISKNKDREVNKLDLESKNFHRLVREGYLKLAGMPENKDRIKIIDASKTPEEVRRAATEALDAWLSKKN